MSLRLGIAGAGFISTVHAESAVRSERVQLAGVASARGRSGLTIAELVRSDDVDAVLVATRTVDHPAHAVAVLEAGKHLLLEKPGVATLEGQALIAEAVSAHPELVVRVAYHRRHDPRFRRLRAAIDAGTIGEPIAVQLASREDFPPSPEDVPAGGFILDVGVHDFDAARWYLGADPTHVHAVTHRPVFREAEFDNVYLTIEYGEAVATTHLSRTSAVGLDVRCEVIGTEGSAFVSRAPVGGDLTVLRRGGGAYPPDCRAFFADAYVAQLDDFAAACAGEPDHCATLEDDRWAVATGVAARASAARGESLPVGPDWPWTA